MFEYLLVGVVAGLIGSVGAIIALKMTLNSGKVLEILEEVMEDEQFQREAYQFAGIVGQGLATGSGLQGMIKGGKPKLKDIATSMLLEYAKQFIPMGNATVQPAGASPQQDRSSDLTIK